MVCNPEAKLGSFWDRILVSCPGGPFGPHPANTAIQVAVDGDGNAVVLNNLDMYCLAEGGAFAGPWVLDVAAFGPDGSPRFRKQFAGPLWPTGVAVDGPGSVLMTGSFRGTVDFGGGALTSAGLGDIFVAKLDAAGHHVFSKRFGSATTLSAEGALAVDGAGDAILIGKYFGAVDFGGGTLTSAAGGALYVAKLDCAGNHVFSKSFDAPGNLNGLRLAVDREGGLVLASWFSGLIDFGGGALMGGDSSIFVARLDPSGDHVFSEVFPTGNGLIGVGGVAVDAHGNVILAGGYEKPVDFGGGPLPAEPLLGSSRMFVAKFDPSGKHLFSRSFGTTNPSQSASADAVAVDGAGNPVIGGYSSDAIDFGQGPLASTSLSPTLFVVKLDPAGNPIHSSIVGAGALNSLALDCDGNALVAGGLSGTEKFNSQVLDGGTSSTFLSKVPTE